VTRFRTGKPPTLRIDRDGYCAEITRSLSGLGNIYHYIVMGEGSREILHWGQERSLKTARACVADFIDTKLRRFPQRAI
jgi:hypothetical protein